MRAAEERFQDATSKPTTDQQTNNWPIILLETLFPVFFFLKKKTGHSQIRTQDLCRPSHIR